MIEPVKCSRACCKRTTWTPKAAGWVYLDEAPAEAQHWAGWWCRPCIQALDRLLKTQGAKLVVERMQ